MYNRYYNLTAAVAASLLSIGAIQAEYEACNECETPWAIPCEEECDPCCPEPCEPTCPEPCEVTCDPCCPEPCDVAYEPCEIVCDPCYQPCEDLCKTSTCCFPSFDFGIDLIYWKACVDDLDYSASYGGPIQTNGVTLNQVNTNNAVYHYPTEKWKPGFRLYGSVDDLWCDWGVSASYTWLDVKNTGERPLGDSGFLEATMTATWNLIGPVAPFGDFVSQQFVDIEQELTYHSYDILFYTDYCFRKGHIFKPFFGIAGAYFNQSLLCNWEQIDTNEAFVTGSTTWDSDYAGIGFKFGGEYGFTICRNLKIIGKASGTITTGTNDSKASFLKTSIPDGAEEDTTYIYTFQDGSCIFVPGYHISIGFEYDTCFCNTDIGLRLGYEFLSWSNLPTLRRFLSEGPPELSMSTNPSVTNIGFHGFYLGLNASF